MLLGRRVVAQILRSASSSSAPASPRGSIARICTSGGREGWLFSTEAEQHQGHSTLLSKGIDVYEVVTELVKPWDWDDYIKYRANMTELINDRSQSGQFGTEHYGSWNFVHGDVIFSAMHMYRYPKGWEDIDKTREATRADSEYQREYKKGLKIIQQKGNEYIKDFGFWPKIQKRSGSNIYDVRTYQLKPGSMYEWGNYWSKGIRIRTSIREDIPWGGFFSQIGTLNVVSHIWVYRDLADRKITRESSWLKEDWHYVVSNTVPLIRSMKTRILEPLPFSPTQ